MTAPIRPVVRGLNPRSGWEDREEGHPAVPLNAAGPLATAQGIARRELGLTTFSRSHVQHYDPERPTSLKPHRNSKHRGTLETPWRE